MSVFQNSLLRLWNDASRIKHFTLISVAGSFLILLVSVFAVKISSTVSSSVDLSKAPAVRSSRGTGVTFTGVVKGLSDTTILVERTVKGKTESIEFSLDKPTKKIEVGDKVKVSYLKKEGKNIVTVVAPVVAKKVINRDISALQN